MSSVALVKEDSVDNCPLDKGGWGILIRIIRITAIQMPLSYITII